MFNKSEFRKYAVKHMGMTGMHVDTYSEKNAQAAMATPNITGLTPYIIEERQLNVASMDVFSRLMMDRIIFLGQGINDYVANIVQAQLLFLESTDPKRDVQIFVNSPGGSVIAGQGLAASMGAVLLSAGTAGKRSCLPHSRVMIHQPLGGMQGQVTDMEISYKLIKQLQKELYDILASHTGQDYDTIAADCERDNWMTATEAKAYGLVDEVLERKK